MKTLTREAIRRMVDAPGTGAGGGGNIDIQNMLGGYATEAWVSENFLSTGFFSRLFQAHGPGENEGDPDVDVNPNDMESTITDIEAMFGFWTEQYLSALGNGGGGGTGGSTALSDLVDVALSNPTNGQALVYNATTGKWTNQTIGGGADMATVWSNLAAATNEQINASHLTNALSGYAQTSALANYLPIAGGTVTGNLSVGGTLAVTGAATLSNSITAGSFVKSGGTASQFLKADGSVDSNTYATQTWVDDNYVSIAFFSRLFKAYNGTTLVSPNNTTATIDNIKAMFGFWTEQYLSALGRGSGGTGGITALTDLVDVAIASPTNGQALIYNSTSGKWTNQTISGGGTDMAAVWSALNAATSEQINASHLTNALSGYATSSDLTGYLPLSAGNSHPLTGNLYFSGNSGISWGTSTGMLVCAPTSGWTGISSTQWGVGATAYQGVIRTNNNDILHYKSGTTYKIWDESNLDISGLFTALSSTNTTNLSVTIGGTTKTLTDVYAYQAKNVRPFSMAAGDDYDTLSNYTLTRGCFVAMNYSSLTTNDVTLADLGTYDTLVSFGFNQRTIQLKGNAYGTARLKYRRVYQPSSGVYAFSPWKEIAFTDGNIATATALATARTLWGQSFDGTGNVSGNMTDVGTIAATGDNTITHSGTTASRFIAINGVGQVELMVASVNWGVYSRTNSNWIIGTNGTNTFMSIGNVGIGTTTPKYKLHVSGTAAAQTFRSTVETGTAPMVVASSTLVTNLNADRLDGKHASDFAAAADMSTLQGYFDASGNARNALRLTTVSKTAWGQTYWTANGVPTNISGDMSSVGSITCTNNSRISNATGSGGSLYIGRSDDAGWVKMSDMCSRQGDSYWKIKSNGDATFGNMLSNGYVTALSDARYKTIVGDVDLSVEQIAAMPTIRYRWNERRDNGLYVGSIAQDWQTILPEVVMTSDDEQRTLSLSYGVAALLASITTARKVVNHEQRIAQLEKENMELRNELNRIKAA